MALAISHGARHGCNLLRVASNEWQTDGRRAGGGSRWLTRFRSVPCGCFSSLSESFDIKLIMRCLSITRRGRLGSATCFVRVYCLHFIRHLSRRVSDCMNLERNSAAKGIDGLWIEYVL